MNKFCRKKSDKSIKNVSARCLIVREMRKCVCSINLLLLTTMNCQLEGHKNSVNRMWAGCLMVVFYVLFFYLSIFNFLFFCF